MRNSIVITAILGAGAMAHPHLANPLHLHQKRDEVKSWHSDGALYVEHIYVKTVTMDNGETAPVAIPTPAPSSSPAAAAAAAAQPVVQEKVNIPVTPVVHFHPAPTKAPVHPAPASSPPEAPPSPAPVQGSQPAPAPASSPAGGSGSSTGPVPGPSNTIGGNVWTTPPNSMGKSILGTANYWRKQWNPSLSDFAWDETLAGNSRETALTSEQGASTMVHDLYPGSMAQCINEGDAVNMNQGLTPFETAWLGWLCERPNSNIPCDKISETGHYTLINGSPDTGHADIIGGTVTKIGCYYMDSTTKNFNYQGMWTCDFA